MSCVTAHKLKNRLKNNVQISLLQPAVVPENNEVYLAATKSSNGGLESTRLSAELVQCGTQIIYNKTVPITGTRLTMVDVGIPNSTNSSVVPGSVGVPASAASLTTTLRVNATLLAANDPNSPDTRFSLFFPPAIPPPQFLQPEFVRYRINYEPVGPQPPCVGTRRFDA
jgi:hypothetical protein